MNSSRNPKEITAGIYKRVPGGIPDAMPAGISKEIREAISKGLMINLGLLGEYL